jgi:hypothetical protein
MNKLWLLLCALVPLVANAQLAPNYHRLQAPANPPKVVFIGDWITYNWTSAFAANPNWINKGQLGDTYEGVGMAASVLARFQSDVVSLHPAIVHILIGQGDADGYFSDEGQTGQAPGFLTNLEAIVQEAKAANIQVVLGTEPVVFTAYLPLEPFNSIIASYGAANNIPVINYGDALCGCISARAVLGQVGAPLSSLIGVDIFQQYGGGAYIAPPAVPEMGYGNSYPLVVTTTGYDQMTQMAETAIANMTVSLKGGWLQNVALYNDDREGSGTCTDTGCTDAKNINTVVPDTLVQFTPIGYYSDGSQHPQLNTDSNGFGGTWTSSNPLVMYVNQQGLTWGNSQGTAIIRYTSPNGVTFSEWVMYVSAPL